MGDRRGTYEVVEWEADTVDVGVCSVEEVIDGESVRFVDGFGARDGVLHGSDDDVGVYDGEVEARGMVRLELPRCLLGEFLRGVVA